MSLDDGATDGEADAHALAFRRVEGIEQLGQVLRVDADAGIAHGHPDTIAVLVFGSDQQPPRPILNGSHRIRGVADQVQDDLLELNAIPGDRWEALGKLQLQQYAISLKLAQQERGHLSRSPVQVYRLGREFLLGEHGPYPRDHLGRAVAIPNGPPCGLTRAVEVRRVGGQHP